MKKGKNKTIVRKFVDQVSVFAVKSVFMFFVLFLGMNVLGHLLSFVLDGSGNLITGDATVAGNAVAVLGNCVDLTKSITWNGKINYKPENTKEGIIIPTYYINGEVTLCKKEYKLGRYDEMTRSLINFIKEYVKGKNKSSLSNDIIESIVVVRFKDDLEELGLTATHLSTTQTTLEGVPPAEETPAGKVKPQYSESGVPTEKILKDESKVRFVSAASDAAKTFENQSDAPACDDCGSIMVRSGACYKCFNCGSTSGCS